jgi:hypothetical protein
MPRDGFVQIRANAEERARYYAAAKAAGADNFSDWARGKLDEPDMRVSMSDIADMRERLERLEHAMARLLETAVGRLYGAEYKEAK